MRWPRTLSSRNGGPWDFLLLLKSPNLLTTFRDIYYRHPDLFVKQAVVDRYVDDLACTFGVSRTLLNVVCLLHLFEYLATVLIGLKSAAAKGLIAGNFTIQRRDGSQINGLKDREVRSRLSN